MLDESLPEHAVHTLQEYYLQRTATAVNVLSDTDVSVTLLLSLAEFLFPKSFLPLLKYLLLKVIRLSCKLPRNAKKCHSGGGLFLEQLSPLLLIFLLFFSISLILKIAGGCHLMYLAITRAKLSSS